MTRTPWTLITIVCTGLFACGDGGTPQTSDGTGTGTGTGTGDTGTGGITVTAPMTEPATSSTTTPDPVTSETGVDPVTTSTSETGSETGPGPTTGEIPGAVACIGKIYQCGDGLDNDGDGAIDNADFECISPCDDDEGSFATNLPGQAEDCNNDCYWDADSGAGQDKCGYNLQCDVENPGSEIGCEFIEECPADTPPTCLEVCVPLIPNGCDCFGCCHISTPDGVQDFYLDSSDSCALDNLAACNHCTFQEGCANTCEGCEVCFGESAPPEGCEPGDQCDEGVTPCTMGGNECPADYYCQTGCCKSVVEPG